MMYLSLILHELGHLVVLKLNKLTFDRIVIGYDKLGIRIGKRLYCSLLPFFGYIEFDIDKLKRKNAFVLFFSGPMANALVFIIALAIIINTYDWKIQFLMVFNCVLFITNVIPVGIKNDCTAFRQYIKEYLQ